ncbi:hypothetical protein [Dethiosulfatarculus sandiegensis]|uniref:Uncharacterized protein n=1 Tax=Dethiosulfatarculus sandiegensis TaxID=1429043 RepID=A0A0D2GEN6_9BACT|nr:hypothetical protein [Dethiosulfatarculus sandiegensis]KIX13417.1 hypothetical protein X474_14230 [Dethiosulfatarculus sandiegensis]
MDVAYLVFAGSLGGLILAIGMSIRDARKKARELEALLRELR